MGDVKFRDEWLVPTLEGLVGPEKVVELRELKNASPWLWETAVKAKAIKDDDLLKALAERFRLRVADLKDVDASVFEIVGESISRRYHVVPVRATDSYLEIATASPFDLECEKMLAFATGREVRMLLASPVVIEQKINETYKKGAGVIERLLEGMGSGAEVETLEDEEALEELASAEEASQRPVIRLVDLILSEGVLSRASDIHIEPEEGGVAVRYRIDGVLRQVMKIPRAAGLPLISRLKVIASLDIADRLRPQDGRARVAVNGDPVDLRISTLPASLGEKVVIRILDASRMVLSLEALGLNPQEGETIEHLLEHRHGVILVTGPTGSGKTTTLYSAIKFVQSDGLNIVTVEDPVEYRLAGIVQVQVHERAGLTFASALRSILRQDPDVVLIGEIRDRETAQIAVQASLTGHLVLSTLHTNDAAHAITRLVDMGLEAFKIGSALRGVVAQRLMRRLCANCKEPWGEAVPDRLRPWIPQGASLYRAVGCPECAMTGYRGRFSIVEVLRVTSEVERLIEAGEMADRIAEKARAEGMLTLWESGVQHVIAGESTIDELLRVVDVPQDGTKAGKGEDRSEAIPSRPEQVESPAATERPEPEGEAVAVEAPPPRPRPVRGKRSRRAGDQEPPSGLLDEAFELLEPLTGGSGGEGAISVLLVDDEDQLRRVLRDLLERDGYKVYEAADGVAALEAVDRHAPDIVVLDLNLPGLDGYNVLAQIRSRPATAELPVLVLTALGDEDNEVRVFELGADDFLSKPFRPRALSARLQAVLGRSRDTKSIVR